MSAITLVQLQAILPKCKAPATWLPHLNKAFDRYEINIAQRQAAFLAQMGHESAQFNTLEENLNYSAVGLKKTFPKYFPSDALANQYARKPQMIANRVYANRIGNGSEASGDGWKFRGRGLVQLTGRSNYRDAGKALGLDLENQPDLLTSPETAAMAAGWFWRSRGLNPLADHIPKANDDTDFEKSTKIINGGTKGLKERRELWLNARKVLKI